MVRIWAFVMMQPSCLPACQGHLCHPCSSWRQGGVVQQTPGNVHPVHVDNAIPSPHELAGDDGRCCRHDPHMAWACLWSANIANKDVDMCSPACRGHLQGLCQGRTGGDAKKETAGMVHPVQQCLAMHCGQGAAEPAHHEDDSVKSHVVGSHGPALPHKIASWVLSSGIEVGSKGKYGVREWWHDKIMHLPLGRDVHVRAGWALELGGPWRWEWLTIACGEAWAHWYPPERSRRPLPPALPVVQWHMCENRTEDHAHLLSGARRRLLTNLNNSTQEEGDAQDEPVSPTSAGRRKLTRSNYNTEAEHEGLTPHPAKQNVLQAIHGMQHMPAADGLGPHDQPPQRRRLQRNDHASTSQTPEDNAIVLDSDPDSDASVIPRRRHAAPQPSPVCLLIHPTAQPTARVDSTSSDSDDSTSPPKTAPVPTVTTTISSVQADKDTGRNGVHWDHPRSCSSHA
ncbi:hypothetical protein HaLaN_24667 [Haematococcus lacustris]|uniref:Uncharacterized protein n=1 Tax=Haematococcus lacustris TaxID=44745 RepID=A0A6A0A355_HAELA|nr:hypothetical protein HaLaN_24667 [Haematococcus lacustris]